MLLTPDEAAARLGIGRRTVLDRRWRARVGLPAVMLGGVLRFAEDDLYRLADRLREREPGSAQARRRSATKLGGREGGK